jgi:acyl carrier protein
MDDLLRFMQSITKNETVVIGPDTLVFREKILDSMNILSLIGYVEERLGRRLEDEEVTMQNFESAGRIFASFLEGSDDRGAA